MSDPKEVQLVHGGITLYPNLNKTRPPSTVRQWDDMSPAEQRRVRKAAFGPEWDLPDDAVSEHCWITFSADSDLRVCARCEARWPTDAVCPGGNVPERSLIEKLRQTVRDIQGVIREMER